MASPPRALLATGLIGMGALLGALLALVLPAASTTLNPRISPEAAPGPPALEQRSGPVDPVRRTPVVLAVEQAAPAVVSITTESPVNDPFSRYLSGQQTRSGAGSGVVIREDGIVLTNAHVVQGATRIQASFADGHSYNARLVGMAQDLDLAVLRLEKASELKAVRLGRSEGLMLGETVIAIGNPFGLGHTVTTGVVSALNRQLETEKRVYQDFIQTDASINPGNSGGPLLDLTGHLVGINTAIRADAEGIGFAIPVDRALKVARDLVDFGAVQIAWLGVDLEDVGWREGRRTLTAARITAVHPGGPAEAAGLQKGDLIASIEGRPMQGRADLNAWLAASEPGRAVRLGLLRAERELERQVTTRRLPDSVIDQSLRSVLGVVLEEGEGAPRVAQVLPGGHWARIGLRVGDQIAAVNGQPVHDIAELRRAVAGVKSGHRPEATIVVRRGEGYGQFNLPL